MKSSSGYEIYHNTLSSVLDEVERYVQSKGYEVGDYFPLINHVSYGATERTQLEMLKDSRIANTLAIQIYRLDSGKYELNCYPVRKFALGGGTESKTFKHKQYDITYQVKPSLTKKGSWEVVESSPNWNENQTFYFVSELDAINYAKLNAGIKTEQDPEARFMRNQFALGGGVNNYKVGDKFKYNFDNKTYQILDISDKKVTISPNLSSYWNNREISIKLMNKWIEEKMMVKTMANGGGTQTYKDLSKETPMVVNDSSTKMSKVPEIDLIRTGKVFDAPAISSSEKSVQLFMKFWNENNIEVVEQMNVLFLSKANKPIGIYQHSKGGIDGTIIDVEVISAMAVKSLAKAVIIAHNHPSGALRPSDADKKMTRQLFNALELFKISLLDSLIITKESYFSFADEGLMN